LSLGADVLAIIVSARFQIPIQLEFDRSGLTLPALDRLIKMEWVRNAAHCFNAVLFIWMMLRLAYRVQ
jgi:hypothetical protein